MACPRRTAGGVLGLFLVAGPVAAADVLAARTLRPGTVLEGSDLRAQPGAEDRIGALIGLEVRRAIYADRPVRASDLGPETLVRRNAIVTMLYRDRGLAIRTEGRALDAGGAGERIRVMNIVSRQSVAAIVTGRDTVTVAR
jgi:flagellar basal body P-ring formation protein FlgA